MNEPEQTTPGPEAEDPKPQKTPYGCLKGGLIILGAAALVVVVLLIINLAGGGAKDAEGFVDTDGDAGYTYTGETTPVSATELLAAYAGDLAAADEQYLHKTLKVTGLVSEAGVDVQGNGYLTLMNQDDPSATMLLQCYYFTELPQVQPGDEVTVIGLCAGLQGNVLLENCEPG